MALMMEIGQMALMTEVVEQMALMMEVGWMALMMDGTGIGFKGATLGFWLAFPTT